MRAVVLQTRTMVAHSVPVRGGSQHATSANRTSRWNNLNWRPHPAFHSKKIP